MSCCLFSIFNNRFLKFPRTKTQLNIGKLGFTKGRMKQVRVLPKHGRYLVELVFEVPKTLSETEAKELNHRYMSVDLGIDNLATIVTNTDRKPVLVKGKNVKAINQRYNQLKAYYTSILRHGKGPKEGPFTSKRLENINNKRQNQIKDLFHKASRHIVDAAVEEHISTIVIGKNKDWKQNVNLGKRNNQSFVSISHSLFIQMIEYKAKEHGIQVITTEESYTSKASFLDNDDIPVYKENDNSKHTFSGRRIKRGLFRSKDGTLINADVNDAANIMRKVFKTAFEEPFSNTEALFCPEPFVLR